MYKDLIAGRKILFVCCNSSCAWREADNLARDVMRTPGFSFGPNEFILRHSSGGFVRFLPEHMLYVTRGVRYNKIQSCDNTQITAEMIALYLEA